MGPLFTPADEWSFVMALIIGIGFGFILESAGFSSSRKLAGVFYGYDFTVLRVFFTAAVVASLGLLYFSYLGWINLEEIYVNRFYIGPTIVGGIFAGIGMLIAGFCPGTSFCAAGIGKIDAMIFIGGIMVGAAIFDIGFPLYADFYKSGAMGPVKIYESLGISKEIAIAVFVAFAMIAFYITAMIQKKFSKQSKKY